MRVDVGPLGGKLLEVAVSISKQHLRSLFFNPERLEDV